MQWTIGDLIMRYLICLAAVTVVVVALIWYEHSSVCPCWTPQQKSFGRTTVESTARCALSNSEFEKRESTVLRDFTERINEWHELSDGYSFQFSGDEKTAKDLTRFVLFERRCCSFVYFSLHFEPTGGPIRLELRGGKDVKEYVSGWLESNGFATSK